jgi:Flp pilus assembly protein TadG
MRSRRRRTLGQAAIEVAISIPVIALMASGGVDLGRAFYYRLPVGTMASAGARTGAVSNVNDIGLAIRTESSAVANSAAAWGQAFTDYHSNAGTDADCSNYFVAHQHCGDSHGCAGTSSFWTTPGPGVSNVNPTACFAIRSCTIDDTSPTSAHTGGCTVAPGCDDATSDWQVRPPSLSALLPPQCLAALQVVVVYRFTPTTPLISSFFAATNNYIYETSTMTVLENY